MHERALGDMKLQSRCPHCHQIEPMGVDIDTQASHECPSCGLRYVPLRHLFVADDLTQVSIAVRDDPVPPPPKGRAVPEPMSAEELAASLAKVAALAQPECAKTGRKAAFDHEDPWSCTLLAPNRAFYRCSAKP